MVMAGSISCGAAAAQIQEYLDPPPGTEYGNTNARTLNGFLCTSPTAVAAREYGYSAQCSMEGDGVKIIVPLSQ